MQLHCCKRSHGFRRGIESDYYLKYSDRCLTACKQNNRPLSIKYMDGSAAGTTDDHPDEGQQQLQASEPFTMGPVPWIFGEYDEGV